MRITRYPLLVPVALAVGLLPRCATDPAAQRKKELQGAMTKYVDAETATKERKVAEYTAAIKKEPDNPANWFQRAMEYYHLQKYDQAMADLDRALSLQADYPEAHYRRGEIFQYAREKPDEAVAAYSAELARDPDHLYSLQQRGRLLAKQGKHAEALQDLERLVALDPARTKLIAEDRGVCRMYLGLFPGAIEDFSLVLQHEPEQVQVRYYRGVIYRQYRQLDEAERDFTRILDLDGRHFGAWLQRGAVRYEKGYYSDARGDMDQAIQLRPEVADPYLYKAASLLQLKDPDGALENYRLFLERTKPGDPRLPFAREQIELLE